MTRQQIDNLKPGDRLMGPSGYKAEVVHRTPNGVKIRWQDGDETLYTLDDSRLSTLTYIGPDIDF